MKAMKRMNFPKMFLLSALGALGCMSAAQGQFAAYGTVNGAKVNGITCTDPQHICASNDGSVRPYGGTLGVFYDFRSYGPMRLGADVRTSFMNTNKRADVYQGGTGIVRNYTGLAGARGTFNTRYKILRPYVQISGGFSRTNAIVPTPGLFQTFGLVEGFAGLDLAVASNVDLRAIEFGAGEMFGSSSHSTQSIGLGIVFHSAREK